MKTTNVTRSAITPNILLVLVSLFFGSTFPATRCFAQQVSAAKTASLERLLGYYQLPSNRTFLEFALKDQVLFAKQLWDGKEYQLVQLNETSFESKEEGHKVEFLKDNSGQVTHARVMDKIMTKKVSFDPRVVRQLPAEQLKKYEGTYIFKNDNNLKLNIRSSRTGLTIHQLWDGKEVSFTPRSETFFLSEDGNFPMSLLLNDKKEATQITCFESDVWVKAK